MEIGCKGFGQLLYGDLNNQYTNIILKYTKVNGIRGKISRAISSVNANNWIVRGGLFRQKM